MADLVVSIPCVTPKRVPVSELLDGPTPPSSLPTCSAPALPTGPCPVCPRLAAEFEPWRAAGYWKAMHDRAVQREAQLKQENEQLRAQLRLREQQLFGRKAETGAATAPTTTRPDALPRRRRGQPPGRPGPRRRDYAHLPAVVEDHDIPGDDCYGRRCGRPFAPVSGTEDSTILEVEVRAYRRVIRRHRYRPTCDCEAQPGIVSPNRSPRASSPRVSSASRSWSKCSWTSTCPTARPTGCWPTWRRVSWICRPAPSPMPCSGCCSSSSLSTKPWRRTAASNRCGTAIALESLSS